jgi:cytochrome c-type biogenesis protein CcmF
MNSGTVQYIGENLLPGQLGHFFIILSFVAALFSCFSFFRAAQTEDDIAGSLSWKKIARTSFAVHALSIIGIFSTLYYIITHHLFEYNYAWQHSNKALPMKYLLSCFWEGQEGSFMLWAFWHSMLGLVVMATARSLETRAMTVISAIQVLLVSMIVGFYFSSEIKIGSTPFILLRHVMGGAPIFADPEYLGKFIKDGNGLNVLLQNYWMVIHPPILFLGFASTLVPFSFIIAGLWKGDYQKMIKPTQVSSLFAGGVLGLGIMMGGAWAYESLNFGGYWAWDPVENASLVPWLTLIAGLHTLIVFKATGRSLAITLILYIITYFLVWYSTFLTRTGVLGDTSVHAFTGEGKSLYWHLLFVQAVILITSISLLIKRWKKLPRVAGEEASSSREFWMTIGAFILILSAIHIILVTSIPVWAPLAKWISGKDLAPPVEREQHYNSVQVWIAILTALLTEIGLYLKFKKTDLSLFWKRSAIIAGVALLLTVGIGWAQSISGIQYWLMLFSAVFALIGSLYFAFGVQKGVWKKRGAALSHFGFALTLLGVLLSSYGKEVISLNTTGANIDLGKKTMSEAVKESRENVILFRGAKVAMGDYFATYQGDSVSASDPRTFFKVAFERMDTGSKKVQETFMLYPDAFVNPKGQEGLSSNPATRHYLTHDIFTYVNSIYKATEKEKYKTDTLKAGDSLFLSNAFLVFKGFNRDAKRPDYTPVPGDVAVGARLEVHTLEQNPTEIQPLFIIRDNSIAGLPDTARNIGLFARFANVLPDQNAAVIETMQRDAKDEYVVLKAIVFPYINVLWLGIITMVTGFMLSTYHRITKKETKKPVTQPTS